MSIEYGGETVQGQVQDPSPAVDMIGDGFRDRRAVGSPYLLDQSVLFRVGQVPTEWREQGPMVQRAIHFDQQARGVACEQGYFQRRGDLPRHGDDPDIVSTVRRQNMGIVGE